MSLKLISAPVFSIFTSICYSAPAGNVEWVFRLSVQETADSRGQKQCSESGERRARVSQCDNHLSKYHGVTVTVQGPTGL